MSKGWYNDKKRHQIVAHGANVRKNLVNTVNINSPSGFYATARSRNYRFTKLVKQIRSGEEEYITDKKIRDDIIEAIKLVGINPNKISKVENYSIKISDDYKLDGMILFEKGKKDGVFMTLLGVDKLDDAPFQFTDTYMYEKILDIYDGIMMETISNIYNDPNLTFSHIYKMLHTPFDELPDEIKDLGKSIWYDAYDLLREYLYNKEIEEAAKDLKKDKDVMNEFKKRVLSIAKRERYNSSTPPVGMNDSVNLFIEYFSYLRTNGANSPKGIDLQKEVDDLYNFLTDNNIWIDTDAISGNIDEYEYDFEEFTDEAIANEIGTKIGEIKVKESLTKYRQDELKKVLLKHKKSLGLTNKEIKNNKFIAIKRNSGYLIYKWNGKELLDLKRLNPYVMLSNVNDYFTMNDVEKTGGFYIDNADFKNNSYLFEFIQEKMDVYDEYRFAEYGQLYIDGYKVKKRTFQDRGYRESENIFYPFTYLLSKSDKLYDLKLHNSLPIITIRESVPMHSPQYEYKAEIYNNLDVYGPKDEYVEPLNMRFFVVDIEKP